MSVVSASAFEYLHVEISKGLFQGTPEDEAFAHTVANVDSMGFDVGKKLVIRCSKSQSRLTSTLDVVKFICKDFWIYTFGKQVNKLRTNHRGVYELYDERFRLLQNFSPVEDMDADEFRKHAQRYLTFFAGVLRGAFHGFGLDCVVTPTVSRSPACSFQCQIIPSSSKEKAAAAVAAAVANASGSGSVNAGADTSGKTDGP